VTLTDAGPLVALMDADEADHARCVQALRHVRLPLLTTWSAFTEAMYLVGRRGGWTAQQALWRLVAREDLAIAPPSQASTDRAAKLMGRYADRPMDLADATLVALAEERGIDRIFTLDGDFAIYRLNGRRRFTLLPG
jgi:uncharacterized protein